MIFPILKRCLTLLYLIIPLIFTRCWCIHFFIYNFSHIPFLLVLCIIITVTTWYIAKHLFQIYFILLLPFFQLFFLEILLSIILVTEFLSFVFFIRFFVIIPLIKVASMFSINSIATIFLAFLSRIQYFH